MQLRRITERGLHAHRRLASKVIIAVPRLSDKSGAADDDVCLEGVAGAVDGVWDVAGPFSSCWVAGRGLVCVLSVSWMKWMSVGRHTNLDQ